MLKKLIDGGERSWGVVGVFAVAILAGMWIETPLCLGFAALHRPLPSWLGCGLNCQQSTLQYTHYRRLRLGTWIEINDLDGVGMPRLPYIVILAGAGIQTECRFYGLL